MWSKTSSKRTESDEACDRQNPSRKFGRAQLALWIALCMTIWLIVLPQIAQWESVHDRIAEQDAKGINPEALFYTDLEVMESVLDKLAKSNSGN